MLKPTLLNPQRALRKGFTAALLGCALLGSALTASAQGLYEDERAYLDQFRNDARPLEQYSDEELSDVLARAIAALVDPTPDPNDPAKPQGVNSQTLFRAVSSAIADQTEGNTSAERKTTVPLFVHKAILNDVANASGLVKAAFEEVGGSESYNDPASVAAAIAANAVCAGLEAGGTDAQKRAILNKIVIRAVRSARGFDGGSIVSAKKGGTTDLARGYAGAAAGAVAQVAGLGANEVTPLAIVVIKAAIKAIPTSEVKFAKDVAQAVAHALAAVSEQTGGDAGTFQGAGIKKAVIQALRARGITPNAKQIGKFVAFGIAQAEAAANGAGAKGIAFYAHNNCNDNAVTDVTGF